MVVGVAYLTLNAKADKEQQCHGLHSDGRLCLHMLDETMSMCPCCGVTLVWTGSKVWTSLYGKASVKLKQLKSTPGDEFGQRLLVYAGETDNKSIPHFAKPNDLVRWNKIVAAMPQGQIKEVVNRCRGKTKGYGLIQYVLNSCDKLIRENKVEQPAEDPFQGMEVMTVD